MAVAPLVAVWLALTVVGRAEGPSGASAPTNPPAVAGSSSPSEPAVETPWQEVAERALKAWREAATPETQLAALETLAPLVQSRPLVLAPIFSDNRPADARVRSRLLALLDEAQWPEAVTEAQRAVLDPNPELAVTAAGILGRSTLPHVQESLIAVWRQPGGPPPDAVANAAVAALAAAVPPSNLAALATAPEAGVRRAALQALRLRRSSRLTAFLTSPELAGDAARAISEERIESAWPSLIEVGTRPDSALDDTARRHALAAAWRAGGSENAEAVAAWLSSRPVPADAIENDAVARFAWHALFAWESPPTQDPVVESRPFAARPRPAAESWEARRRHERALKAWADRLGDEAQSAWKAWETKLDAAPRPATDLAAYLQDSRVPEGERVFHLRSRLTATPDAPDGALLAEAALAAADAPALRSVARAWSFPRRGPGAIAWLLESLSAATAREKQDGIRLLDQHRSPESQLYLLRLLNQARHGLVDPAVVPEVVEAIERRARAEGPESRSLRAALDAWRASQPPSLGDPLRPWRPALQPGDAEEGRRLFYSALARCDECHDPPQRGIPSLEGVADRLDGPTLLEAVTLPADPATRRQGPLRADGGCRPMGTLLTLRELRDLLCFLRESR